jgi:hypothetical protein
MQLGDDVFIRPDTDGDALVVDNKLKISGRGDLTLPFWVL